MASSRKGGAEGSGGAKGAEASPDSAAWTPPPALIRSASEAKAQIPLFCKGYKECRETLGKMSAKARGERCHPASPVQLRDALPSRDCTSWVRQDKQYHPYCKMERPDVLPSPKMAKTPLPPKLWLPKNPADGRKPGSVGASLQQGGSSSSKPAKAEKDEKPPWDTEHHIMFSRLNHEVRSGSREYFDVPKAKDNVGVPKVREEYLMHDRQCGWNDEPNEPGELRRTLFDTIGPFNLGGCKQQQVPSYWRKVRNWHAYSAPDLSLEGGLSGSRSPTSGDRSLLEALADAPASQTTDFWRGWALATAKPDPQPRSASSSRGDWDGQWSVTWSKDNEFMNKRQREYFSVPHGRPGRSTQGPRGGRKRRDPYLTQQALKQ